MERLQTIDSALEDPRKPPVQRHLAALGVPVARIIRATATANAKAQRHALVDGLSTRDARVLMPLLMATLRACREQLDPSALRPLGLQPLLEQCIAALTAMVAEPVRQPGDWSIAPPMVCDCDLCKFLGRFLAARDRVSVEWPLAKDRRSHVHGQIDSYGLPVAHVTRRVGRPYKLVITKRQVLFTREAERREALEPISRGCAASRRASQLARHRCVAVDQSEEERSGLDTAHNANLDT